MSTTLPQRFSPDQHQRGGAAAMATWAQVEVDLPAVAATMRAYLDQIAVVLRPGSVEDRSPAPDRAGSVVTLVSPAAGQFKSDGSGDRYCGSERPPSTCRLPGADTG